jgi:DNA-binding beta-propeller fold protein YncE
VRTVIGTSELPGGRLFVFGDRDGQGLVQIEGPHPAFRGAAEQTTGPLLQHAIGVAYHDGNLYVADTYNNKIKVVDPDEQTCRTLAGTGQPGRNDGPADEATFDEPAGLAVTEGKLYVADTNNHLIRVIDLAEGNQVGTLAIDGLQPPELTAP